MCDIFFESTPEKPCRYTKLPGALKTSRLIHVFQACLKSFLLTYVASDLLRDDSPERALRGER